MEDQGENKLHYYEGHDPLERVHSDQPEFNRTWLRFGAKQTTTQRIGFCIMSFVLLMGSIMWLHACVLNVKEIDGSLFFAVIFGVLTFVFLYLSLLAGFRNAFRSKTQ